MRLNLDHLSITESPLSRLDPRWKLAALGGAALSVAFLRTIPAAGLAWAGALLLAMLGRLPPRWLASRLAALALFLVPVAIFLPLPLTLLLSLKALSIVTLMLVLVATAPLNDTFKAAHALWVPGLIIHLAMLSYRYIFVLATELARLRVALRVRGYRNRASRHSYRTIGHVGGTLLVRGYERAERVGQAMRCRGFDGRFRSLAEFQTTTADLSFFVAVAAAVAGLLLWEVLQG